MRARTSSASDCSILPFSTARPSCFSILAIPLSRASWSASRTTTSQPAWAQICEIPWPMSPQPTTPTLLIAIFARSSALSVGARARVGATHLVEVGREHTFLYLSRLRGAATTQGVAGFFSDDRREAAQSNVLACRDRGEPRCLGGGRGSRHVHHPAGAGDCGSPRACGGHL